MLTITVVVSDDVSIQIVTGVEVIIENFLPECS